MPTGDHAPHQAIELLPRRAADDLFVVHQRKAKLEGYVQTLAAMAAGCGGGQGLPSIAFRGELVPQDPNDEPAAELLQRLAASRDAAPKTKRGRSSSATA